MADSPSSIFEIHPLLNPLILEKIFSFLQIHSLKNSRLTCKTWSKVALPFLQKVSKVVLVRGGKADHDRFSFRNFLELISSIPPDSPIPFENYYLEHWALNEKRERSLKQFWDLCGPCIKTLHLSNVIFYEVETIRNLLYYWSPQLQTLLLEDCLFYTITNENEFINVEDEVKTEDFDEPNLSYDYYDHVTVEKLKNIERCEEMSFKNNNLVEISYDQLEEEEFPLAWEEVFHAFPNIQRLKIACTTPSEQISKILSALHTAREESNALGNVTEMHFFQNTKSYKLNINDTHLYKISDIVYLTLTSLSFIINDFIKPKSIVNVVRQYSPVLKNLCIHSEAESTSPLEIFKFQRFPCLLKLCVSLDILGEDFNFIQNMPKLQRIYLWQREEEFNWETSMDDVVIKSSALKSYSGPEMKEISFGYIVSVEQTSNLICCWFKNLRVLMMALTDEVAHIVFRELSNLEEITVFDRHLTDVGITGNPRSLTDSSRWRGVNHLEFPYIGDLKNKKLWKFSLTFRRYENITDFSIYQGLMDVPSLSSILLTRTKIGETALRDLSLKSNVITLVTPSVCKGIELEYSQ